MKQDDAFDELLSDERGRGPAPAGARERVRGRVARTLGLALATPEVADGGASGAATSAVGAKAIVLAVLGLGAVAAVALGLLDRGPERAVSAPARPAAAARPVRAEPEPRQLPAAAAAPAPDEPVAEPAPHERAAVPAPRHGAARKVRTRDLDLDAERAIVADARGALARGDADTALATLGRHEDAFTQGRLSEERESLRVSALVRAGRLDEARAHAARFRARWPSSLYLAVVEEALRSIP